MNFRSPMGMPLGHATPPQQPATSVEEYRRQEEARRARHAVKTFRAPGPCTLHLAGHDYISRRHATLGWIIDVDVASLNSKIHGVRIQLGHGDDWMELRLEQVSE